MSLLSFLFIALSTVQTGSAIALELCSANDEVHVLFAGPGEDVLSLQAYTQKGQHLRTTAVPSGSYLAGVNQQGDLMLGRYAVIKKYSTTAPPSIVSEPFIARIFWNGGSVVRFIGNMLISDLPKRFVVPDVTTSDAFCVTQSHRNLIIVRNRGGGLSISIHSENGSVLVSRKQIVLSKRWLRVYLKSQSLIEFDKDNVVCLVSVESATGHQETKLVGINIAKGRLIDIDTVISPSGTFSDYRGGPMFMQIARVGTAGVAILNANGFRVYHVGSMSTYKSL